MKPAWTIRQAIDAGRLRLESISETSGLDVQLLLADILQRERAWVLAHPEFQLNAAQTDRYCVALQDCACEVPLPYVLGWWEFYGRRFLISEDVLIPRPETEHLVDAARQFLFEHPARRKALDVGTGSGCIAISLLADFEDLRVTGVDLSARALAIAKQNARRHRVEGRLALLQGDLLSALTGPFDLVCANLPYIPRSELARLSVSKREPWLALDGGEEGLELIGRMLDHLPGKVNSGGRVLIELEASQGRAACELARRTFPAAELHLLPDLAGRQRVLRMDV